MLADETLVIDDRLPEATAVSTNTTFLPPTGLEVLGIREPQDVVRYAVNQSATDSGSRSFGDVYSVRGLTNTVFFGAPSTTIYVDDVPFGETFTYAQDLGPINGVEVLRGPQPTLVGRNAYGGLVNVTTQRPGDTLEGGVGYQYGSYDRHGVDAWVTSPLGESASFRFNGGYDSHDGYLYNPNTGERVDHQESFHFGGAVYLDVAPGWEVGFILGYAEQNDGAPRLTSLDRTGGFYTVESDVAGEQHRESNYQAIRVAHENDRYRFLSVTSHRGFDLDPYMIDLDFTPFPFGSTTLSQSQELWSQEFRWSDNTPNAAWGWHTGLYGSTSRIEGEGFRDIPAFFSTQTTSHVIDEQSFAVFGGLEYRELDPFTLRFGGRLDWIQRSLVRDKTSTIPVPPFVVVSPTILLDDDWVHFTPTAGIDWELSENATVYLNAAYAFKPGGFSAYADDPAFVPFDEEKALTTELGLRSSHFGGKVKTNFVGFYSDVEDYQVERSFTLTDYAVFNAGEAEIYGAEFEATVEISPTLDFLGSIGWTHARLTRYIDPVTLTDLSGVTAPFVPEFDAVVALDYHLDCGFFARIEMIALGNVKFDDFNRDEFQQDAYALVNSSIGFRKDNWSVALYGTNLGDKEYYTNMNPEIRTGAVGIPREYGVRVGFEF